ncbi:MAG: helix-turn-helix transcriptional regulator [Elusimicrobia bacterium]|nr:helix-turn-helix transcriptional regulator [Elusimicrobiota bacterium]
MEKSKKIRLPTFNEYSRKALEDPKFRKVFETPDEDPFIEIAYQIVKMRTSAGLTQKELARRLRVSQQAIARLESVKYRGHSLSTLLRIATALKRRVRVEFLPV